MPGPAAGAPLYLHAMTADLVLDICCVGMSFMPESPRWQYAKGQQAEAQAGAVKLWGQSGPDQLSEGELLHLCSALFGLNNTICLPTNKAHEWKCGSFGILQV